MNLILALALLVGAFSQQPVKIYLEAPDSTAAIAALRTACPDCSPVIKKEASDFVILVSAGTEGKFRFSVFENVKGSLLKDGDAASLADAVKAAVDIVRATPVAPPPSGKATVFVYRYRQFTGSALKPAVYCDEIELAGMENGRVFAVELDPGKHTFRSNDKQAEVQMNCEPGKEYYLRIEIATGFWKGHGRVVVMMPEQGVAEIKKVKWLDASDVRAPKLVRIADK
jgi:hypothetical protein